MTSPYSGKSPSKWMDRTRELNRDFPIKLKDLADTVLDSWEDIFRSAIGSGKFHIGKHMFPQPQIMGFFLHELIPLSLAAKHPGKWKVGDPKTELDAHYVPDARHSFEIKTSSSAKGIFGNRSYAHLGKSSGKRRSGRLLAVNFDKFAADNPKPRIRLIRFGWLDPKDWIGQRAESGQQAHLTSEAKAFKLEVIWDGSYKT